MAGVGKNITKATTKDDKKKFSEFMNSNIAKAKITEMIGGKDGQRFMTSMIAAVSLNPNLQECDNWTILSAAMQGEALKLSPSPQLGHYHLVPFEDNKRGRKVATFQIGYKGLLQLAIRSGQYRDIDVIEVREGEFKGLDKRTGRPQVEFIEDSEAREKLKVIGYFAFFELLNGFTKSLFWTREKMEAHALKYSKGYASDKRKGNQYTFWSKDFDGMAFKTLLRQIIGKWGIMSIEMQQAFERDGATITENGTFEYVDGETGEIIEASAVEVVSQTLTEPEPESQPAYDAEAAFFE